MKQLRMVCFLVAFIFCLFFQTRAGDALAGPSPSENNCGFYLDLEKDLGCWFREKDDSDYLVKYGYKFCNIFKNRSIAWSDQRSAWVKKTTFCLQDGLKDYHEPANCVALEDAAFKMHPGCYRNAGFCGLSKWQKTTIVTTAFGIDVLLKPASSFGQGFRLLKDCIAGVSTNANALFERARTLAEKDPSLRGELAKLFFLDGLHEKDTDQYLGFAARKLLGDSYGASDKGIDAYVAVYGGSQPVAMSPDELSKKCASEASMQNNKPCREAAELAGSKQSLKAMASIPSKIDRRTISEILAFKEKLKKTDRFEQ